MSGFKRPAMPEPLLPIARVLAAHAHCSPLRPMLSPIRMDQGISSLSLNPDRGRYLDATGEPQEGLLFAVDRRKQAKMKKTGATRPFFMLLSPPQATSSRRDGLQAWISKSSSLPLARCHCSTSGRGAPCWWRRPATCRNSAPGESCRPIVACGGATRIAAKRQARCRRRFPYDPPGQPIDAAAWRAAGR